MDHPTWVPASASSAGGASASANQEWSEQLEALVHWTEEDLSAKEIEELKLIKDMVTSEEQGSFLAYENDTVPAHASALIQIDSDEEVARRLQERLDGVVPPGPPPQHGRRATLQCATGLPLFPCRAAGQPAKRQRTSGASPSPELSVAKIKEAFGRAAPDGLLDVGLVNTLMRHFRMKFIVQELEDRVNAVVGNGHLLVFPEFLSLMAGKMTGTEDAFMDAEEADRCSAATTTAAAGTGGKGRRRLPDADAHGGRLPDAERRPRDAIATPVGVNPSTPSHLQGGASRIPSTPRGAFAPPATPAGIARPGGFGTPAGLVPATPRGLHYGGWAGAGQEAENQRREPEP